MNAIAANELKRHGIAAIEKLFAKGPVHVIKRNRPVCVVLTEAEYERLTRVQTETSSQISVIDWFSLPPLGAAAQKSELDDRLSRERDEWESQ
jgi:hypothetical protein